MLVREPLSSHIRILFSNIFIFPLPNLPSNFTALHCIPYYCAASQLFLERSFFTCHLNAVEKAN